MSWSLRQTRRGSNRDFGGSFHGMMVRQTYTKAAHLTCLKEMLPKGKITLVGEQESQTTRVAPHIFRNLIKEDLFEWFVIAFDKKASEPRTAKRIADSNSRLKAYKANFPAKLQADMSDYEIMEMYCAEYLKTEFTEDRFRNRSPYANKTFESLQFPQVWIRSPVQHIGETEKVIGFPLLRRKYRAKLKRMAFDQEVQDPELRAALARRALKATIQPVSSFMNSLRRRTSPTERAGGKGARSGPSFISGAMYNPPS